MSGQSVQVPYSGASLESGKKYSGQVRVWDQSGKVSAWSEPFFWQMGLLKPADWKAKWITAITEDTLLQPSPLFRKKFTIAKKIASATAYITSHGLYEASINGKRVGDAYLTPGWTSYHKRLQYQQYDITPLADHRRQCRGCCARQRVVPWVYWFFRPKEFLWQGPLLAGAIGDQLHRRNIGDDYFRPILEVLLPAAYSALRSTTEKPLMRERKKPVGQRRLSLTRGGKV